MYLYLFTFRVGEVGAILRGSNSCLESARVSSLLGTILTQKNSGVNLSDAAVSYSENIRRNGVYLLAHVPHKYMSTDLPLAHLTLIGTSYKPITNRRCYSAQGNVHKRKVSEGIRQSDLGT